MKTKFDRWLIRKFIYKTHVYTLRLPDKLPRVCHKQELEKVPGRRFNYKLTMPSAKGTDKLINLMHHQGLTFKTDVIEKNSWYSKIINPHKKSFTWRVFWLLIIFASVIITLTKLVPYLNSPEFQNFKSRYVGSIT